MMCNNTNFILQNEEKISNQLNNLATTKHSRDQYYKTIFAVIELL